MATRMQQRRGAAADWTSANPVLGAGEIGFETDTTKFKMGDGTTAWSSLQYFTSAQDLLDGAPALLDTLNELAAAIGDDENFFATINDKIDSKASIDISDTVPTTGADGAETLQEGDLWYDRSTGHVYMYYNITGSDFVWVETGGSDDYAVETLGTNNHDFPVSPSDGDVYSGYSYDSSRTAWQIIRNTDIEDLGNVSVTSAIADNVVMYNDSNSTWENVPGVRLVEGKIPTDYTTLLQTIVEDQIDALALDIAAQLTVQEETAWDSDTTTPDIGSINISSGASGFRIKIGDGINDFASLELVPNNSYVAAEIASAIAGKSDLDSPTFIGTVVLPSTTSVGTVDSTEIGYLDGVTSSIQTQINTKAPTADPTFTGTVSGITKSMVGLGSADNTADADKPVSNATQTALDDKLDLSGGTLTGELVLNADPTQALGAVTKQYADSISAGLHVHASVTALSDSNVDITGVVATTVIDGVTIVDGARVILNGQTDSAENGIYIFTASGSTFARAEDFDEPGEVAGGDFVFVTGGTVYDNTGWAQTADSPAVIGTDPINFTQFSGAGSVTAGTNASVTGTQVSVVDAPVFAGIVDASAAGVEFSDGTQTKAGVPSVTGFVEKTASYTLDILDHQDNIVEMNSSGAVTFTIPTDAALAWPVGASMDIFASGTGVVTIAGDAGVTVNATPGLILRTQWSSATLLKRGADNWIVYGDLKA